MPVCKLRNVLCGMLCMAAQPGHTVLGCAHAAHISGSGLAIHGARRLNTHNNRADALVARMLCRYACCGLLAMLPPPLYLW
jgi:hypothetical protein